MCLPKIFIWLLVLIAPFGLTIGQFLFGENIQGQLLPQAGLGDFLLSLSPLQILGIGLLVFGITRDSSKSTAAAPDTCSTVGYTRDGTTGVCYKVITTRYQTPAEALAACNMFSGGRLLRVDSAAVQTLGVRLLSENSIGEIVIDGTRSASDARVYLDSDGGTLTFFDWFSGFPGNACCFLVMLASGKMQIVPQQGGSGLICELPPRR